MQLTGPDPEGDIFLAIARTEVLRMAGQVGDEVVDAGRSGLESAAAWGIESFPTQVVRGNMSAALRLSGQVGRAAELIDPVISHAEPTHEDIPIHHERASIDMLRGRCAEALSRFGTLAAMPTAVLSNRIEAAEHVASAELWCGRPGQAFDHLVAVLRESMATAASAEVGADLALAARAAADVADASGAAEAARYELLGQLTQLQDQARIDPFAQSGYFLARPAHGATWAAESARHVCRPSLELWAVAARHWDGLGRPHDAAYCRWRGAQVALATGQGTLAARLLRRAATDARGHVPLTTAIADTSAHAREAQGR